MQENTDVQLFIDNGQSLTFLPISLP